MTLKRSLSLASLLLIAAPPLLIGLLIFRDGVDVPFWDQWDGTAPLFEKMAAGTLRFADFFAQHNEHRILFPQLIFFGLGRLTHWNVRAELFLIWFLGSRLPLQYLAADVAQWLEGLRLLDLVFLQRASL